MTRVQHLHASPVVTEVACTVFDVALALILGLGQEAMIPTAKQQRPSLLTVNN